jgi:Arc/MetJ-type ribon-helix-helix transcriptional regulator
MATIKVQVTEEMRTRVREAAAENGFASESAFVRQAIGGELLHGTPALGDLEKRLAAQLQRLESQVQMLLSVVTTQVKTQMLWQYQDKTVVEEAYAKFEQKVVRGMNGSRTHSTEV